MDINNCLNKVFSFFDSLNKELSLGFCLVDTFSNCFSFLSVNWKDFDSINTYWKRLNNVFENSLINQNIVFIAKSVHHTMNVTSTEAKLFAIRCSINCTIHLQNVECIVVIIDAIPAAK